MPYKDDKTSYDANVRRLEGANAELRDEVDRLREGKPKRVRPAGFSGLSMSLFGQLIGSGPKFTVKCGACYRVFKSRIEMITDSPVVCKHSGVINVLPVQVA